MFLLILFFLLFLLWAANGFWAFLPAPLAHLILVILIGILGYMAFGNPTDADRRRAAASTSYSP